MMVYYSAHADICSHTDQSQEHHARRKKSNSKGYILHDSIHMAILEKVKPQGQKSVSGCLSGRDTGEGRKKTIKEHEWTLRDEGNSPHLGWGDNYTTW